MAKKKKKQSAGIPPDVEAAMLAILEYAMKRRAAWHKIGSDPIHRQAVDELKKQGVIEVWRETGLYRVIT
jgi:hypothetical protein